MDSALGKDQAKGVLWSGAGTGWADWLGDIGLVVRCSAPRPPASRFEPLGFEQVVLGELEPDGVAIGWTVKKGARRKSGGALHAYALINSSILKITIARV